MNADVNSKSEINVNYGGQVIVANDDATVIVNQNNRNRGGNVNEGKKFQNNKKQYYIDNWNSRMFLHLDNDQNPLTLADAFITPDYDVYRSVERIGFYEDDKLDVIIDKFMKYDRTSTMLITGVPGIGKSSITSWIANRYKDDDNVIVLRFRDWEYEELNFGLLKAICNTLACNKEDLEKRVLMLDGFDEIKALDRRDNLLGAFIRNMNDFENLKCIITSRPAYVDIFYFENVFELKEFDVFKVENFYKTITGTGLTKKEKIEKNVGVLGIPVILYMAIMSDVDICENPTKPELYNRIFAERGGIFDRLSKNGIGYSLGAQILRDPKNTKKYLNFLCKVAIKMFEKGRLTLTKDECVIPFLETEGESVSVLEFPIKHLFEDVEENIEFVHKSIYEYFVAEYISIFMCSTIDNDKSKGDMAGILGKMFRYDNISEEIWQFLKYKVVNGKLKDKFDIVNKVFGVMLKNGMTFSTKECYKNVINCEMNVFANMLGFLHLWDAGFLSFDDKIFEYINYKRKSILNLSRIDLKGKDLTRVNLSNTDLSGADLSGADLSGADLVGCLFKRQFDFGANLTGANLTGALVDNTQVNYLESFLEVKKARIYHMETRKIMNYEEYMCILNR